MSVALRPQGTPNDIARSMKSIGIPPLQSRHKKGDKWRAKRGDLSERKLAQGSHGSGEWDRKDEKTCVPKRPQEGKQKYTAQ